MSTTGWTPARSTTEQRRSASWEIAIADVPWPDWPRGDLNLATLELLGREKDLTYIATLCSAGLIRIEIFAERLDATDTDTAKPETGRECKPGARAAQQRRTQPSVTDSVNARAVTAAAQPASRAAFAKRRGLTPADGFHEWRRDGGVRPPWLIALRDGGRMAFAALRERWRAPRARCFPTTRAERWPGELVETFTILTIEASHTMRTLHHRMPVMLAPESFKCWLAGDDVPLGPAPENVLGMHPVGRRVNCPRNDGPRCVAARADAQDPGPCSTVG